MVWGHRSRPVRIGPYRSRVPGARDVWGSMVRRRAVDAVPESGLVCVAGVATIALGGLPSGSTGSSGSAGKGSWVGVGPRCCGEVCAPVVGSRVRSVRSVRSERFRGCLVQLLAGVGVLVQGCPMCLMCPLNADRPPTPRGEVSGVSCVSALALGKEAGFDLSYYQGVCFCAGALTV